MACTGQRSCLSSGKNRRHYWVLASVLVELALVLALVLVEGNHRSDRMSLRTSQSRCNETAPNLLECSSPISSSSGNWLRTLCRSIPRRVEGLASVLALVLALEPASVLALEPASANLVLALAQALGC